VHFAIDAFFVINATEQKSYSGQHLLSFRVSEQFSTVLACLHAILGVQSTPGSLYFHFL